MKPLSIEDIKQLEKDDWLWVINIYNEYGSYMRIKASNDKILSMVFDGSVRWYHYLDYGKTWLAYKNKEQAECKGLGMKHCIDVINSIYGKDFIKY